MDKGPDDRQRHGPEQQPCWTHVGSRIARVDHADPLLEQWICRYQQKQENAAEKYGDEPHGKPALQCRQIEGADGIAEKSERADQIEIAQRRGALAETTPLMIGRQQQTNAERQNHEGERHDVEFLNGGDKGGQQEDACHRRLLPAQRCKIDEQRAAGHGNCKNRRPIFQFRVRRTTSRPVPLTPRAIAVLTGKDAFASEAGVRRRRGEIGHYCATCLEGKIASQHCRGTLAEPPTVVSQPCGNRHSITATDLQDGLSGAVVQLCGKRSARVQDFYAVSVQPCLCARVRVTSLIRAMVSSHSCAGSHSFPCKSSNVSASSWSGSLVRFSYSLRPTRMILI